MADKPTVHFIQEIMAFDYQISPKLTRGQISLWYALFNEFNRAKFTQWFPVSISWLQSHAGMSATAVYKARNVLKQAGLIDFQKGQNKSKYARYRMTLLVKGDYYNPKTSQQSVERSVGQSVERSVEKSLIDINNKEIKNTSVFNSASTREKNDVVIPIFKLGGGRT